MAQKVCPSYFFWKNEKGGGRAAKEKTKKLLATQDVTLC